MRYSVANPEGPQASPTSAIRRSVNHDRGRHRASCARVVACMTAACLWRFVGAWQNDTEAIATMSGAIRPVHPKEDRYVHDSRTQVLSIAAMVSLAAIGTVAARSAPPDIGRGVDFSEEHCFSLFFSHVRNDCGELHNYEMPLTMDNSGSKTVAVNANDARFERLDLNLLRLGVRMARPPGPRRR